MLFLLLSKFSLNLCCKPFSEFIFSLHYRGTPAKIILIKPLILETAEIFVGAELKGKSFSHDAPVALLQSWVFWSCLHHYNKIYSTSKMSWTMNFLYASQLFIRSHCKPLFSSQRLHVYRFFCLFHLNFFKTSKTLKWSSDSQAKPKLDKC